MSSATDPSKPYTRRVKCAELELAEPIPEFRDLDGYHFLQLLLRWHGRPCGIVKVPVRRDRCTPDHIIESLTLGQFTGLIQQLVSLAIRHPVSPDDWKLDHFLSLPPLPAPAALPTITVAVCTRDRSEDLKICLESIHRLRHRPMEILVIDNAPTSDATCRLVESSFPEVRYIVEPRPGLDWARNRAAAEAHGDIVAYTDDDVVVDARWTEALAGAFGSDDSIMAVTGLVVPHELETEAQALFETYGGFGRGTARKWYRATGPRKYRAARSFIGAGQFGTGANMAYRRRVFQQTGLFDPALDVGTVTNGGGDLDMFFRVLKHGHTLVYEPAAVIWHRHRRDYAKLRTQIANNGVGLYSHFVRNAREYPEERSGILRFGFWWFRYWLVRRWLKSHYKPPAIPRDLIVAEFMGALIGLRRYRQARKQVTKVVEQHGPGASIPFTDVAGTDSAPRRTGIAVRTLEVTGAARPLEDVTGYSTTDVFVTWNGIAIGKVRIENDGRPITVARLADEVSSALWLKLIDPADAHTDMTRYPDAMAVIRERLMANRQPESDKAAPPLSASVVIATCDRPDELRRCLASLTCQKTRRPVEIVVVDNRPDSGIAAPVVAEFPAVKLIEEPRPGPSYARNAGFAASSGDILLVTDDDVAFPPGWIERTIAPFERNDIAVVSGNVLPAELDAASQIEFENYGGLNRGYTRREYDFKWFDRHGRGAVPTWEIGGTANAAIRAAVLVDPEVGMLHEALGPGTPTGVGEDTYLFYKALKAGYTVLYEPASWVWHHHRATDLQLDKQIRAYSTGHTAYNLATFLQDGDTRGLVRLCTVQPKYFLKQLWHWLRRSRRRSLRTILLEIRGYACGPVALWRSLRRVRRLGRSAPYVAPALRNPAAPPVTAADPR